MLLYVATRCEIAPSFLHSMMGSGGGQGGSWRARTDSAFDWRYDRAKSAVFPAQLRSAEATLSRLVAKTHVGGTELCEN